MADLFYALAAVLLAAFAALDGFDLGAGVLHRVIARSDDERRAVLRAVGPYWDGNEVFLLAAGGTLFASFPRALASLLSGLYLAVFPVLWALLGRGLSLELRDHVDDPLWRDLWDLVFQLSSAVLTVLLGVALGNLLRGFPLDADGWFALELFSRSHPRAPSGVIDASTLPVGLLALSALTAHGARFLVWKTQGALRDRALRAANLASLAALPLALVASVALRAAAPAVLSAGLSRPLSLVLLALASLGPVVAWRLGALSRDREAFVASAVHVASSVLWCASSLHPNLARSTGEHPSLTTATAVTAAHGLDTAARWWPFAAALVVGYFANLFRVHRGRVG